MTDNRSTVKRRTPNRMYPKDWDRRARIVSALSEHRITQERLADTLDVSEAYVSATIWGRRRLYSIESAIASALGRTWDELFAPADAEGRAA